MTFQELLECQSKLFGVRDLWKWPGLNQRLERVAIRVVDLKRAVETGNREALPDILSSLLRRMITVVYYVPGVDLQSYMARKFAAQCRYCHQDQCVCPPEARRQAQIPSLPLKYSLGWTISEFQQHLEQLYGERNRRRVSDENIAPRIASEVLEIMVELYSASRGETGNASMTTERFVFECCDVIAWIIAASNLLGVDLEQAVVERPFDRCERCRENPCSCQLELARPPRQTF